MKVEDLVAAGLVGWAFSELWGWVNRQGNRGAIENARPSDGSVARSADLQDALREVRDSERIVIVHVDAMPLSHYLVESDGTIWQKLPVIFHEDGRKS